MNTLHVVTEVPGTGKTITRDSSFTALKGAKERFLSMSVRRTASAPEIWNDVSPSRTSAICRSYFVAEVYHQGVRLYATGKVSRIIG
jgi:hypothetical protein